MKKENTFCLECYEDINIKNADNISKIFCHSCGFEFYHVIKINSLKSFYYRLFGDPNFNYMMRRGVGGCIAMFIWIMILGYAGFDFDIMPITTIPFFDNTIFFLFLFFPFFVVAFYLGRTKKQ